MIKSIADGEAERIFAREFSRRLPVEIRQMAYQKLRMIHNAQALTHLMSQVVVFHPLIEHPVYVGQDSVNGVPIRTYGFEVRSLGAASGVEATRADGTYAIAVDGEYLVSHTLDMELRTAPEGDPRRSTPLSLSICRSSRSTSQWKSRSLRVAKRPSPPGSDVDRGWRTAERRTQP